MRRKSEVYRRWDRGEFPAWLFLCVCGRGSRPSCRWTRRRSEAAPPKLQNESAGPENRNLAGELAGRRQAEEQKRCAGSSDYWADSLSSRTINSTRAGLFVMDPFTISLGFGRVNGTICSGPRRQRGEKQREGARGKSLC